MSTWIWLVVMLTVYLLLPSKGHPGPLPSIISRWRRWRDARNPSVKKVRAATVAFRASCPVAFLWPDVHSVIFKCIRRRGYICAGDLTSLLGINPRTPKGHDLWNKIASDTDKGYQNG